MILGIGIDICNTERIKKNLYKFGDYFSDIILTDNEKTRGKLESNFSLYLTSLFATKEAFYKAFNLPSQSFLTWKDIEVITSQNNAPKILMSKKINEITRNFLPLIPNYKIITQINHFQNFIISKILITY